MKLKVKRIVKFQQFLKECQKFKSIEKVFDLLSFFVPFQTSEIIVTKIKDRNHVEHISDKKGGTTNPESGLDIDFFDKVLNICDKNIEKREKAELRTKINNLLVDIGASAKDEDKLSRNY